MNFQLPPAVRPLRVFVVNPLSPAAQMVIVKILSGKVFGYMQLVDLTMLVYSNERAAAQDLKLELNNCAFSCCNSIEVTSDLPLFIDADVFCFITNIKNPNSIDIHNIDSEQFDALYLVIKIANGLSKKAVVSEEPKYKPKKKNVVVEKLPKPIIMTDGLITMSILKYLAKDNIPADVFFCPTPLTAIAKTVLGEHLKVKCHAINDVLVWAASDVVFHIEVEKPLIKHSRIGELRFTPWDADKDILESSKLDVTQFNDSWMKKEFHEKVALFASKNPYGCISLAADFAKTLGIIWQARSAGEGVKTFASVGVISDGSLDTLKGRPYILPLVFTGDNWSVDDRFEESSHVQQEIIRMNKVIKKLHDKLIPYCKKFLQDNVINQSFIPVDDTESEYTLMDHSSCASGSKMHA